MNPNQVTPTLCFLFACLMLMCLAACSDSDKAAVATAGAVNDTAERQRMGDFYAPSPTPFPQPTPFYDGAPFDAHTSKKVRNAMGMGNGWTTDAIRREDAERARYQKRLAEWQAQNGGAK